MKNLHLMPMNSTFDDSMVSILNANFPDVDNVFILSAQRIALIGVSNCLVDSSAYSVEYINEHANEYHRIFLHSLDLSPNQLIRLSDDAASKITWIVWGHDLYTVKKTDCKTSSERIDVIIHTVKKLVRGTYIRECKARKAVREKVSQFHSIGIGFPYDERIIRKKYGKKVPVVFGPVMSPFLSDQIKQLREARSQSRQQDLAKAPVRILLGHSGFDFLEHEKYLKKLAPYKGENIHIHMVLCYGASPEKIEYLTKLALNIFGAEKVTIQTEMISANDYNSFLSQMDIGIFPFLHQSALGNTKRMAYMGTKLYFDPRGVLAKGFLEGGVHTYDCRRIGKITFDEFSKPVLPPDEDAPLFRGFEVERCISAWKNLLYD